MWWYLRYQELRAPMARSTAPGDARELGRPTAVMRSRRPARVRPPAWVGTATREAPRLPGTGPTWGFPDLLFTQMLRRPRTRFADSGASPGVAEGTARFFFFQRGVRPGPPRKTVRRVTKPAWVVLFTKIAWSVDRVRRQRNSHPAWSPGRSESGGRRHERCRRAHQDGRPPARQRHHRNRLEILDATGRPPRHLEEALPLREVLAEDAMVHAGGPFGILMNNASSRPPR